MNHNPPLDEGIQTAGQELTHLANKIKQYRQAVPISFALIIIFFFFGFCNFKCNGTEVASLRGINLVTGTHLSTTMDNAFGSLNAMNQNTPQAEGKRVSPNFWAILAFLSALAGAAVFYKRSEGKYFWGTILGAAGFISLVILRWVIKAKVSEQGGAMVQIDTSFLFGYWASLLAFIVSGGVSYLCFMDEKAKAAPSLKAAPEQPPIQINVIASREQNNDE